MNGCVIMEKMIEKISSCISPLISRAKFNRVSAKFPAALLRGMNAVATACTIRGVIASPRLLLELFLVTCSEVVFLGG